MRLVCAACGANVDARERVGRRDTCSRCGVDLHSCRQCRFYDPRVYNACREPQAEGVLDKDRGNFCDFFAPRAGDMAAGAAPAPAATSPPPPPLGKDVRDELARLFRRR